MFCICISNDCPNPISFTLYRIPYNGTPRPISHTLCRMGVFLEGRVILIVFQKYISILMKLIMYCNIYKYFIYTKGSAIDLLSFLKTQLQWVLNNIYTSLNLKSVTVGKIWLQKIKINHKNKNFTIDFSVFWNCYGRNRN